MEARLREGENLKITFFDAVVEKREREHTNGKEKAYAVDRAACDQQA
jgi:hypothetical protein